MGDGNIQLAFHLCLSFLLWTLRALSKIIISLYAVISPKYNAFYVLIFYADYVAHITSIQYKRSALFDPTDICDNNFLISSSHRIDGNTELICLGSLSISQNGIEGAKSRGNRKSKENWSDIDSQVLVQIQNSKIEYNFRLLFLLSFNFLLYVNFHETVWVSWNL